MQKRGVRWGHNAFTGLWRGKQVTGDRGSGHRSHGKGTNWRKRQMETESSMLLYYLLCLHPYPSRSWHTGQILHPVACEVVRVSMCPAYRWGVRPGVYEVVHRKTRKDADANSTQRMVWQRHGENTAHRGKRQSA